MRGRRSSVQSAKAWRLSFFGALLVCLASLGANLWLGELRSGNGWGVAYGIAAAILMVGVALLGARRRVQRMASRFRLGAAATWLRFHLYGGTLFLVLVLMHSGFRWPQGTLAAWLLVLSLWTTGSGWLGLALQRLLPRMLASGLAIEVLYERIPELVEEVRSRAERIAASASEPIRAFYASDLAPAMAAPRRRWVYYLDIRGARNARSGEFDHLRRLLGAEDVDRLAELQQLFETKLEIDAHYTLQRPLRLWLYLHVPPSCALLALVAVHVVAVWWY